MGNYKNQYKIHKLPQWLDCLSPMNFNRDNSSDESNQSSEASNDFWQDLDLIEEPIEKKPLNTAGSIEKQYKQRQSKRTAQNNMTPSGAFGFGSGANQDVSSSSKQVGQSMFGNLLNPNNINSQPPLGQSLKIQSMLESEALSNLNKQLQSQQDQLKKLKIEKDNAEINLRKEKLEKQRFEGKIKKMENAHDIEKRNLKTRVKNKAKDKYNFRLNELQKKFKAEIENLIEQFNESRTQLIKRDFLIKKLLNMIALQEQQNVQFRSELCISEHPRWQIIPSFEMITIIDLSKLIHLIQDKYHPPIAISNCDGDGDEERLQKLYEQRKEQNNLTMPAQSYLAQLLSGAEGILLDRPSAQLSNTFGANKSLNDDVRVLNVKIDRLRKKNEQQEEKLDKQSEEFQILKELYEEHLCAYENAINIKQTLEAEIRNLRSNLDVKINEMISGYKEREDIILASKNKMEQELFQFKNDSGKELELKDVLLERQQNYIMVLKKELVFAKNIIKNPNLFQKAFEDMNFDQVEYHQRDLRPIDRAYRSKIQQNLNETAQNFTTKSSNQNLKIDFKSGRFTSKPSRSYQVSPRDRMIQSAALHMPQITQIKQVTKRNIMGIHSVHESPKTRIAKNPDKIPLSILREFTTGYKNLHESTFNEDIVGFQSQTSKCATPFTQHDLSVFMSKPNFGDKTPTPQNQREQ
eukprot:403341284